MLPANPLSALVVNPTASFLIYFKFLLMSLAASKNLSDATPTSGLYAMTAAEFSASPINETS